jgi:hypothetical protein
MNCPGADLSVAWQKKERGTRQGAPLCNFKRLFRTQAGPWQAGAWHAGAWHAGA